MSDPPRSDVTGPFTRAKNIVIMPIRARLCPTRATAVSAGTTCALHPDTHANTAAHARTASCALIKRHGTALCQCGAAGRDRGLSRVCGPIRRQGRLRLRRANPSARVAAGRAVRAVTGRRAWTPAR
eukprot:4113573-Prymnesium_polylepis.1